MDIHSDLGWVGGMFIFMLLASDASEPSEEYYEYIPQTCLRCIKVILIFLTLSSDLWEANQTLIKLLTPA